MFGISHLVESLQVIHSSFYLHYCKLSFANSISSRAGKRFIMIITPIKDYKAIQRETLFEKTNLS